MNATQSTRIDPRHHGARSGATAVEFAIVAPIFFLFLMAAFEFGWLNVLRHTADNAAYEAARAAMVPGGTAADARAKANSILSVIKARNVKVTVTPSVITTSTDHVTVAIDVPLSSNALVTPHFTSNKTIHCSATLRTERVESGP
jgi:Flp pilus assembly protein TadG